MKLLNVMEILVKEIIDEMIQQNKMCRCDRCQLDVAAIALNNLPPAYVVSVEGESIKSSLSQYRIDAMQMVVKAINQVAKQPHHNR